MGTVVILKTATGAGTFVVPSDWNNANNSIECIGGGSGGNNPTFDLGIGCGGAGAGYSRSNNVTLTIGNTYNLFVGAGGAGGTSSAAGGAGGATFFGATTLAASMVGANGATAPTSSTAGVGGSTTGAKGSILYAGGSGSAISTGGSNGGGGAGGPNGNGANGNGGTGSPYSGSGGGASGGGSPGASAGTSSTGGAGGNNFSGSGGGAGGTASSAPGNGINGGGGGGAGAIVPLAYLTGGAGGNGVDMAGGSAGAGGGGGASSICSASGSGNVAPGGAGGLYGGGGGAGGFDNSFAYTSNGGAGAQGIIVITYVSTSNTITWAANTNFKSSGYGVLSSSVIWTDNAAFLFTGSLTINTVTIRSAKSNLSDAGLFSTTGTALEQAIVAPSGVGQLIIFSNLLDSGTATFPFNTTVYCNATGGGHTYTDNATLSGTGLLSILNNVNLAALSTFSGSESLTTNALRFVAANSISLGVGLLTTTGTSIELAKPTVIQSGLLSTSATALELTNGIISGTGLVVTTATTLSLNTCAFSGSGLIATNATHTPNGSAVFGFVAQVIVAEKVILRATIGLSVIGALQTNATHTPIGSSTISGIASISATASSNIYSDSANLASIATIILAETEMATALSSPQGAAQLIGTATLLAQTNGVINDSGLIITQATHTPAGSAIFSAIGSLGTTTHYMAANSAILSGSALFQESYNILVEATSNVSCVGTINTVAFTMKDDSATLSGLQSVSAIASCLYINSAAIYGTSSITTSQVQVLVSGSSSVKGTCSVTINSKTLSAVSAIIPGSSLIFTDAYNPTKTPANANLAGAGQFNLSEHFVGSASIGIAAIGNCNTNNNFVLANSASISGLSQITTIASGSWYNSATLSGTGSVMVNEGLQFQGYVEIDSDGLLYCDVFFGQNENVIISGECFIDIHSAVDHTTIGVELKVAKKGAGLCERGKPMKPMAD